MKMTAFRDLPPDAQQQLNHTISQILVEGTALSLAIKEAILREIEPFLQSIGKDMEESDVAGVLSDARTLRELGKRYGVHFVGMPAEEKRQAGRPSARHYDWAFRITQSGQLSDEQAFVMVLAMQGIDSEALPQAERQKRRNAFDSAMKRRKGQKI